MAQDFSKSSGGISGKQPWQIRNDMLAIREPSQSGDGDTTAIIPPHERPISAIIRFG
jgi:hypothetical protein